MSAEDHDPGTAPDDPSEIAAQYTRIAFWKSLEPTDADATLLADRIIAAARRSAPGRPVWRKWRSLASLAACIALSFAAGWLVHSHRIGGALAHLAPPHPTNPGTFQVALTDAQGHVRAVQAFDSVAKAREFAHDVGQWQARAIQVQKGTPVILADRF